MTSAAGKSALAYIQRQALTSGRVNRTSVADRRAAERADRLKGEGAEDKPAAAAAGDRLGDDHVRSRVVAAERQTETEQADNDDLEVLCETQSRQERGENDHLHDEHGLTAESVR